MRVYRPTAERYEEALKTGKMSGGRIPGAERIASHLDATTVADVLVKTRGALAIGRMYRAGASTRNALKRSVREGRQSIETEEQRLRIDAVNAYLKEHAPEYVEKMDRGSADLLRIAERKKVSEAFRASALEAERK